MRGKAPAGDSSTRHIRITPAYAGKSIVCLCIVRIYKDHPRLCGEKSQFRVVVFIDTGSPPPMRGKVDCTFYCVQRPGITPAYAGKSTPK